MDKETELMKKRFIELAKKAESGSRYFFTGFLNIAEQNLLHVTMNELHFNDYSVSGGHEGAERMAVCFGSQRICGYEEEFPINCLLVQPQNVKFSDELTHRDYLGALMNLGIERTKLGDIILIEHHAYIFCIDNITDFVCENLNKIRHTNVICSLHEGTAEELSPNYEGVTITVASERLDAVLSKLYNMSRNESNVLFSAGRVFINAVASENNSYIPHSGDIISVRGYGKFIYDGVEYINKKGKNCVKVRKYI